MKLKSKAQISNHPVKRGFFESHYKVRFKKSHSNQFEAQASFENFRDISQAIAKDRILGKAIISANRKLERILIDKKDRRVSDKRKRPSLRRMKVA